jgi:diaminopimelate epimerase
MRLKFTKMQSLGNDFVLLNGVADTVQITEKIARHIADRHFGIGCDQILVVESRSGKRNNNNGYLFRIFNSDGSEVGQCGNGARCFARYLHDQGLTDQSTIQVKTKTTTLQLCLNPDATVTVAMGIPEFAPDKIPLSVPTQMLTYHTETRLGNVAFGALSIGNPHCVLLVEDVDNVDVRGLGTLLENDPMFPERVNVGFSQVVSRRKIHLRVHERGVGETLGCGSGACAAVVSGICNGLLDSRVEVVLPGGNAWVEWNRKDSQVYLTGPTHKVFEGSIEI